MRRSERDPQVVYVIGPIGDPDPAVVARNLARGNLLGRILHKLGWAPVVPHANGPAGVYDSEGDNDAGERARYLANGLSVLDVVRRAHGFVAVLEQDDGELSEGSAAELEAWTSLRLIWDTTDETHRRLEPAFRGTWADLREDAADAGELEAWQALAGAHARPPVGSPDFAVVRLLLGVFLAARPDGADDRTAYDLPQLVRDLLVDAGELEVEPQPGDLVDAQLPIPDAPFQVHKITASWAIKLWHVRAPAALERLARAVATPEAVEECVDHLDPDELVGHVLELLDAAGMIPPGGVAVGDQPGVHRVMRLPEVFADLGPSAREVRLEQERDRLQVEVLELRGDVDHEWVEVEQDPALYKTRRWKCAVCDLVSKAPVRAYYQPCPGHSGDDEGPRERLERALFRFLRPWAGTPLQELQGGSWKPEHVGGFDPDTGLSDGLPPVVDPLVFTFKLKGGPGEVVVREVPPGGVHFHRFLDDAEPGRWGVRDEGLEEATRKSLRGVIPGWKLPEVAGDAEILDHVVDSQMREDCAAGKHKPCPDCAGLFTDTYDDPCSTCGGSQLAPIEE